MTDSKKLQLAIDALSHYADPESYHAIGIFPDRPSGWFADDMSFSQIYRRPMPGKLARRTLKVILRTKALDTL